MTRDVTVATLLSALTVGLAVSTRVDDQSLRCEAGNFALGEDASITCRFHKDVGRTIHHIYVTHYPFDSADIQTQVLICFRLHTKEHECKVADGYSFNGVVSDNLTLAIPEVRGHFAGRYSCKLFPPEGIPNSTCDLNVNGTALTCQAGSFTEGEMASVTCYFHKNIENTSHHVYVIRYPYNTTEKSTTALVCFRLHDKQLECRTEEGYRFNGVVSHKLTLEIPEVRKRFAGRYSCQIVPPDGVPLDVCHLNVKDKLPRQPSHSTTEQTGHEHDSGLSRSEILAVVFGLLFFVTILLVVGFCACIWKRRINWLNRSTRTNNPAPNRPPPPKAAPNRPPPPNAAPNRPPPPNAAPNPSPPPANPAPNRPPPQNAAPNPSPPPAIPVSEEDDESNIEKWSDEDDECAITTESEDEEKGVKIPLLHEQGNEGSDEEGEGITVKTQYTNTEQNAHL